PPCTPSTTRRSATAPTGCCRPARAPCALPVCTRPPTSWRRCGACWKPAPRRPTRCAPAAACTGRAGWRPGPEPRPTAAIRPAAQPRPWLAPPPLPDNTGPRQPPRHSDVPAMTELALIMVSAILVNNFVLVQFLGLCPFMGVSKKVETAIGLSLATTFVLTLTAMCAYLVQEYLLEPLGLEFLRTISFILVIAVVVQFTEMVVNKTSPLLYRVLGIFLPLI